MQLSIIFVSFIFLFLIGCEPIESLPNFIRIGALMNSEAKEEELAFNYAIEQINRDLTLMPQTTLVPHIEHVDFQDSFLIHKKVCSVLRNAVVAIFGPKDSIDSMQVQSICEAFEVPLIEMRPDFESYGADQSINLFPHPSLLVNAFIDLVREWKWKSFAIVYEENSEIISLKEFFNRSSTEVWDAKLFHLSPDVKYRDVMRHVKQNDCKNIILSARTENIEHILRQALQAGALTEEHHYLVMNLDLHTMDLEKFLLTGAKFTSLRLVDENYFETKNFAEQWSAFAQHIGRPDLLVAPKHIKTELALIYDGIKLLARAINELNVPLNIQPISCNEAEPWPHGTSLINYMRRDSFYGMSGLVKFDESGFRSEISLDVLTHTFEGIDWTGQWKSGSIYKHENWDKYYFREVYEKPLIRIVSVVNAPFFIKRKSSKALSGNDQYEGYVIDLVEELAKILHFRWAIHAVKDGKYGSFVNGKWNGMVGEVIRDEADIAVADLTINQERAKAIDFTYPFMSTGVTILYKKPSKVLSLWSFMFPFSYKLWLLMFFTLAFVGVIQVYVGRFTPYEWTNTMPCRTENIVLENGYCSINSFWFAIGAIMQQGSDIAPKAMSTRVIAGVWSFFTLIIVSSYTANLAAFLTVEDAPYPFDNVDGLANSNVKYGCLKGGATYRFFNSSNIPLYKKIADFMNKNPSVLKSGNDIGRDEVERANGKYAFFMESATIEYITERYCNLTQVGGLLDSKGYGIATKKGSKYRQILTEGVLKLQETGVLRTLKERWWKQKYGGGSCSSKPAAPSLELGIKNVGGVFLILIGGALFSIALAFYELFMSTLKESQGNFGALLIENLKFSMKVSEYTKPVKKLKEKSLSRSKSYISEKSISISPPEGF